METIVQHSADELLKLGLAGLVIIGLVIHGWMERKDRRESQECRFADLKSVLEHVGTNTVAMDRMAEAQERVAAGQERMAQGLEALKAELATRRR